MYFFSAFKVTYVLIYFSMFAHYTNNKCNCSEVMLLLQHLILRFP